MVTSFKEQLVRGKVGEGKIARWLMRKGWAIIPVYEIEGGKREGPKVFTSDGNCVSPDMIAHKDRTVFVEAKTKTVFSWFRKSQCWVTGIDLKHFDDYIKIASRFPTWDFWLLFLHESSSPSAADALERCPNECPIGLFGGSLSYLEKNFSHKSPFHGQSGMVYWRHENLKMLAPLEELNYAHANEVG